MRIKIIWENFEDFLALSKHAMSTYCFEFLNISWTNKIVKDYFETRNSYFLN
jgi:hypothetical protein